MVHVRQVNSTVENLLILCKAALNWRWQPVLPKCKFINCLTFWISNPWFCRILVKLCDTILPQCLSKGYCLSTLLLVIEILVKSLCGRHVCGQSGKHSLILVAWCPMGLFIMNESWLVFTLIHVFPETKVRKVCWPKFQNKIQLSQIMNSGLICPCFSWIIKSFWFFLLIFSFWISERIV